MDVLHFISLHIFSLRLSRQYFSSFLLLVSSLVRIEWLAIGTSVCVRARARLFCMLQITTNNVRGKDSPVRPSARWEQSHQMPNDFRWFFLFSFFVVAKIGYCDHRDVRDPKKRKKENKNLSISCSLYSKYRPCGSVSSACALRFMENHGVQWNPVWIVLESTAETFLLVSFVIWSTCAALETTDHHTVCLCVRERDQRETKNINNKIKIINSHMQSYCSCSYIRMPSVGDS